MCERRSLVASYSTLQVGSLLIMASTFPLLNSCSIYYVVTVYLVDGLTPTFPPRVTSHDQDILNWAIKDLTKQVTGLSCPLLY